MGRVLEIVIVDRQILRAARNPRFKGKARAYRNVTGALCGFFSLCCGAARQKNTVDQQGGSPDFSPSDRDSRTGSRASAPRA
jgi:hypothetical protein